jgi:hypothetical protein
MSLPLTSDILNHSYNKRTQRQKNQLNMHFQFDDYKSATVTLNSSTIPCEALHLQVCFLPSFPWIDVGAILQGTPLQQT